MVYITDIFIVLIFCPSFGSVNQLAQWWSSQLTLNVQAD